MKTAMQELIESLENDFKTNTRLKLKIESFKEYLEKEKEQIIYDYMNGKYYHQYEDITAENYYNQTYNN
jgi:hypothetical protein